MSLHHLHSLTDPRLAPYHNLKDRQLSARGGLFIAEGEHVVRRLLESDFPTESVLLAQRRAAEVAPRVPENVPVYVVPNELLTDVLGFKFHSGVLAVGRRKLPPALEALAPPLKSGRRFLLVVCPEIINTENLGALLRISAGFGADAMLVGERSCDPFWRRAVRVSMGAAFTLPIRQSPDIAEDLVQLREQHGFDLVAAVCDPAARPLEREPRPQRLALLLGSEAQGLHGRYLRLCHRHVTIPVQHGTDSLNVAIAAGVFLYHFTRVAR